MDAEIINVDAADDQSGEKQSLKDKSSAIENLNWEEYGSIKPKIGMKFLSQEDAKKFYDAYTKYAGFNTHAGEFPRKKSDGSIVTWDFTCSAEVFKRNDGEACNAMLRIERKNSDWVVTKLVDEHNHPTVAPIKAGHLRPQRQFSASTRNLVEPNGFQVSTDGNHISNQPNKGSRNPLLVEPSCPGMNIGAPYFFGPCIQKRTFGRDAQALLNYFKNTQAENPGFFYAIQLDNDYRMTNAFWADPRSRNAYSHFGDAVVFDTMYRPNHYQVPFAPFTGVNHHGQMVLFGCALILDESEASFIWLFQTWLAAMNSRPPVSIITDQDRAIKSAVTQVFPETRHCICKWHILRESQERLAHIYLAYPSFYGELSSCINFSETIEDFELSWCSLLGKYDLCKNEWLQAVYNARAQWAPVYFRDTFFAAISSNQGFNTFFDGYVNQQTALPFFFKQYEIALGKAIERETEADYEAICTTPVLKTPSPMEQQAANQYTRKLFAKFQEEFIETFAYTANKIEDDGMISKYRVAKYELDHKAYIVKMNVPEMKADCSCQMFAYAGILCRHILTVFTVTNILILPSHYILKRWTINAKVTAESNEQGLASRGIETVKSRFNNLCYEAIKYAEEGAVAEETYIVALDTLREGAKKIVAAKKTIPRVGPFSSLDVANSQEENN